MRLLCYHCGKSVSNEVPDGTIVRACLECPECIEFHAKRTPTEQESREKVIDEAIKTGYKAISDFHPVDGLDTTLDVFVARLTLLKTKEPT